MTDAGPMIETCLIRQHPEAFGRPEIHPEPVDLRAIEAPDSGPDLPVVDPGYEDYYGVSCEDVP